MVGVDMGGTSFDVSVVRDGRVNLVTQGEIDKMPVRLPMVEIRTIGAGGGSIATVRAGGRLTVGPESAGSRPGPACYGRGGTRADRHRRQPRARPAGRRRLPRRRHAARCGRGPRRRSTTHVAQPLGLGGGGGGRGAAGRHQRQPRRGHPPVAVREGARSARLRDDRLRRRGGPACHRGGRRARHPPRGVPRERQHAVGLRHPALQPGARPGALQGARGRARKPRRRSPPWPTACCRKRKARLDGDAVPAADRQHRARRRHALQGPGLRADRAGAGSARWTRPRWTR